MRTKEMAIDYYEKEVHLEETDAYVKTEGDEIYCCIGDLLEQLSDRDFAGKLDMMILEMSEADRKEYFIKGFEAGVKVAGAGE